MLRFSSISQFLLASMQATVLSGVYSAVPSFVMIFVIPLSGQVADLMRSTRYFSTTFVRKVFGAAGTAWFFSGAFALVFPNSSVACPHWHHMAMVTRSSPYQIAYTKIFSYVVQMSYSPMSHTSSVVCL